MPIELFLSASYIIFLFSLLAITIFSYSRFFLAKKSLSDNTKPYSK